MKEYTLTLLLDPDQTKIGTIGRSDDYSLISVEINEERQAEYLGVLRRIIVNVIARGNFKVVFDTEAMKIEQTDEAFWEAILQTLIANNSIFPQEV